MILMADEQSVLHPARIIRIAPRSCVTWRGAAGSCAPDGGIDKYQKLVWRVVVAGLSIIRLDIPSDPCDRLKRRTKAR
jgi:hypothetical protein